MDALGAALAAWRACPAPELAALVVRAGKLAGAGRDAITGLDHAERAAAWDAVEKRRDPADLDRLLESLVDTRCAVAVTRLAKLASQPRDPRLVFQLVRYIEADPELARGETSPVPFTSAANRKFWTALLTLVEARGDATLVPRFQPVIERARRTNFETWLAGKLGALQTTLATRVVSLDARARAALTELEPQIATLEREVQPSADTADALYAAVWADPDADAPRIVLADFLSERGDPRGEFIALQLARAAGTLDAAGKRREKELLKRHKKAWLGPIEPLIQPYFLRFERGFLVTCSLEPNAELERRLGDHPAWSTIREYLVHGYAKPHATKLEQMLARRGAKNTGAAFTRGIE